jgi:hypothetical protein
VIWETKRAIVFEDKEGNFWRRVHSYGQCWPVIAKYRRTPRASGSESRISQALRRIADSWDSEVEARGKGDPAWAWIKASPHYPRIMEAEDSVNHIGSTGDPAALLAACDAWAEEWEEAIDAWRRDGSAPRRE